MGLIFRRRVRVRGTGGRAWLNLSRSGVSASVKPHRRSRLTVNSRGRATVRLGKGVYWRFKL